MECENCGSRLRAKQALQAGGIYRSACPKCGQRLSFRAVAEPAADSTPAATTASVSFKVNGASVTVDSPDPQMSLNEYLRTVLGHTDVRRSCEEGGCGACVVYMESTDPVTQKPVSRPINSCLHPICATNNVSITTSKGIGSLAKGFHPVQKALVENWGSQCGMCSPGFTMSMYSLLQTNPSPTAQEIELALDGNICRCTGYRPILTAFKTFSIDAKGPATTDVEDLHRVYHTPCQELPCGTACQQRASTNAPKRLMIVKGTSTWITPTSLKDLLQLLQTYQDENYMLVNGNTSTGVFKDQNPSIRMDISQLAELQTITMGGSGLTVGAGVTLANLMAALEQNSGLSASYPTLLAHMQKVANTPVRSVGTWAGNLMMCHDHDDFPSDMCTILAGAGATVTLASITAVSKPMSILDFLSTNMAGQILLSLTIPTLGTNEKFATHKVMKRHVNCHAYVNAACWFQLDGSTTVKSTPRLIFGRLGPKPFSASNTAAFLVGLSLGDQSTLTRAVEILQNEIVTDQPPAAASAQYRKDLAAVLLYKSILAALPNLDPR